MSEIWSFLLCVFQYFLFVEVAQGIEKYSSCYYCNVDAYESAVYSCAVSSPAKRLPVVRSARAEFVLNGSCNSIRNVNEITKAW